MVESEGSVATQLMSGLPARVLDDVDTRSMATASSGGVEDAALPSTGPAPGAPISEPIAYDRVRDPGRYAILGEHGRGALGRVSRAHDKELGRDIAIKELIKREPLSETRFLREALITARLEHPGIVAVHEAGRWTDGTPFYAMKLVSGRPLRELILERTTPESRLGLLHHVIAVSDAIAYAHRRNIIHRDLKPANVIVGEFGETIVIDWGLAKDLAASEELLPGDSLHARPDPDSDLTSAGTVLGTPAYMAPEQQRAEPVDQRADVFAIGVMLWELCAPSRDVPPRRHDRDRVLRRAGIDKDLATIICKALDPIPAARYADAGALANDLKAFKSGARIAARGYSLFGKLAHAIRRHSRLAFSILAATLVAIAGVTLFVVKLATERDRSDTALDHLQVAIGDRILEHVQLLLHTDPTAAWHLLRHYEGSDTVRARRLRAEAEGRGVASWVLTPHSDTIWFLRGDKSGAIVSVASDHRIRRTHGNTSTTIADDVATDMRLAYAPVRQLLAYANSSAGISLLDLRTLTSKPLSTMSPVLLAFSSDGSRLAALDLQGELRVWAIEAEARLVYRATLPEAKALRFATSTRLIALTTSELRTIPLDTSGGTADVGNLPDSSAVDVQGELVVGGTVGGRIAVLSPQLQVLGSAAVCRKRVEALWFIPGSSQFVFSCQDPFVGVARYDAQRREITVVETFDTRGSTQVNVDADGRYVLLIDESHTASVYEVATRLLSRYDGNVGLPSYVSAPTEEYNHVLIGDVNGAVRVWDPPSSAARVVVKAPAPVFSIAFTPDSTILLTGGAEGIVRKISLGDGAVQELRGHRKVVHAIRALPDGDTVVSLSYDSTARTWRAGAVVSSRVFAEHARVIVDADHMEHGRLVVSVADDGRLLAWPPHGDGAASTLFKTPDGIPLTGVEALSGNGHVVVMDGKGGVWDITPGGDSRRVREPDGAVVTTLRSSRQGSYVATGTSTGEVTVYETASWQVIRRAKAQGSVRQIQFDPRDRDLLVASAPGPSQLGHVQIISLLGRNAVDWREVIADARDATYAPDGEMVALTCADGSVWWHSFANNRWMYFRDHAVTALNGRFSPDGQLFASSDIHGVVVVRDVGATLHGPVHSQNQERSKTP
ncbi:MAG: protein kinase [Myxococcales bacterium]|nr:protein kinase [Myxococcales bacterium]